MASDDMKVRGTGTRVSAVQIYGLNSAQGARVAALELAIVSSERLTVTLAEDETQAIVERAKAFEKFIVSGAATEK